MKGLCIIGVVWCALLLLAGCSIEKTDKKKIKDLEFAIVEESQLPAGLLNVIEEKKVDDFKLTFATEKDLYIVSGYGTQPTNGYSIAVQELYLTSNAIYIDTNLIGPAQGEEISKVDSYPYIVVKIDYTDMSVIFN
jgi:hypothetical protein